MAAAPWQCGKAACTWMTEDLCVWVRFVTVQTSLRDLQASSAKSITCSCFLQHLPRIQLHVYCRQMSRVSASSCCHLLGDNHRHLSGKGTDLYWPSTTADKCFSHCTGSGFPLLPCAWSPPASYVERLFCLESDMPWKTQLNIPCPSSSLALHAIISREGVTAAEGCFCMI